MCTCNLHVFVIFSILRDSSDDLASLLQLLFDSETTENESQQQDLVSTQNADMQADMEDVIIEAPDLQLSVQIGGAQHQDVIQSVDEQQHGSRRLCGVALHIAQSASGHAQRLQRHPADSSRMRRNVILFF